MVAVGAASAAGLFIRHPRECEDLGFDAPLRL
jgi:hypothetical protein